MKTFWKTAGDQFMKLQSFQRLLTPWSNSGERKNSGSMAKSSPEVRKISDSKVSLKSWSMILSGNMSEDSPRRILRASSTKSSWSWLFSDQTCGKKNMKLYNLYKYVKSIHKKNHLILIWNVIQKPITTLKLMYLFFSLWVLFKNGSDVCGLSIDLLTFHGWDATTHFPFSFSTFIRTILDLYLCIITNSFCSLFLLKMCNIKKKSHHVPMLKRKKNNTISAR